MSEPVKISRTQYWVLSELARRKAVLCGARRGRDYRPAQFKASCETVRERTITALVNRECIKVVLSYRNFSQSLETKTTYEITPAGRVALAAHEEKA